MCRIETTCNDDDDRSSLSGLVEAEFALFLFFARLVSSALSLSYRYRLH